MIAVYQRCLANYQGRQWDLGAHALFNKTLHKLFAGAELPTPPCYPLGSTWPCLSDCLLAAARKGTPNSVCLDAFLQTKNVNSLDYFEYANLTTTPAPSHLVDACQVFSGPALLPGPAGEPYRICLDTYQNNTGICKLPHIVWSGRSTNKVAVGIAHGTVIADREVRRQAAMGIYDSIRNDVKAVLDTLASWDASRLKVAIFSAEGDLLYQFFDCLVMGRWTTWICGPVPTRPPSPCGPAAARATSAASSSCRARAPP